MKEATLRAIQAIVGTSVIGAVALMLSSAPIRADIHSRPECEPACSSLCRLTAGPTVTLTNPDGGTMTVTYEDLSPGICWCNEMIPPCDQLDPCSGKIVFSFDDHASWGTWVPHVTSQPSGTQTPVCAHPAPGSDQPPAHSEPLSGCGSKIEFSIEYWKKRLDSTSQVNIAPDIIVSLKCTSCDVNNCQ